MSKIDQLKLQYKRFNLNILDFVKLIDRTKSHKYSPVICKILDEHFRIPEDEMYDERVRNVKSFLETVGIDGKSVTLEEGIIIKVFLDSVYTHIFELIKDLIDFGERGLLPTKDILKYNSIEEIKNDISIAALRDSSINLESQITKEYEDDTWLAVRPLSHLASMKYGASTKWCTTSKKDKEYFAKYWDRGILVYFINKKTGYKFALYKQIKNGFEFSLWNAADDRVDSLELECDDYIYPVIKKIIKSKKTNSDFCDEKTRENIYKDCHYYPDDTPSLLRVVEDPYVTTVSATEYDFIPTMTA